MTPAPKALSGPSMTLTKDEFIRRFLAAQRLASDSAMPPAGQVLGSGSSAAPSRPAARRSSKSTFRLVPELGKNLRHGEYRWVGRTSHGYRRTLFHGSGGEPPIERRSLRLTLRYLKSGQVLARRQRRHQDIATQDDTEAARVGVHGLSQVRRTRGFAQFDLSHSVGSGRGRRMSGLARRAGDDDCEFRGGLGKVAQVLVTIGGFSTNTRLIGVSSNSKNFSPSGEFDCQFSEAGVPRNLDFAGASPHADRRDRRAGPPHSDGCQKACRRQ